MMTGMEFSGYMIKVRWDGQTLVVHPTSRPAAVALLGKEHKGGDLVLDRDQIADVQFVKAGLLTNGRVTVRDTAGRRYVLHFRKRQQPGMAELARELGATV